MRCRLFLLWVIFLHAGFVWALPRKIEVWFLSSPEKAFTFHKASTPIFSLIGSAYASYINHVSCRPVPGETDLYVHPQLGIHRDGHSYTARNYRSKKENFNGPNLPSGVNKRRLQDEPGNLIHCDKDYHFDLFCGQEKKRDIKRGNTLEVWVDTSSSMKFVDRRSSGGSCYRKKYVEALMHRCPRSAFSYYRYDRDLQIVGATEELCRYEGDNDASRLWANIQKSTAKKLVVITDIDEYTTIFKSKLGFLKAIIKGNKIPFAARSLPQYVRHLYSYCQ